jgi:hypothetical protein
MTGEYPDVLIDFWKTGFWRSRFNRIAIGMTGIG